MINYKRYTQISKPKPAIQWTGENIAEIHEFVGSCSISTNSKDKTLHIKLGSNDYRGNYLPHNGWAVNGGKNFRDFKIYTNQEFREQFTEVEK